MANDNAEIAESIRSGRYFSDARAWYRAVYIGPISERTFFLIIALIAGLVAVFSVKAVMNLMPMHSKLQLVLPQRGEERVPRLVKLKQSASQTAADALERYFVLRYIDAREGYSAQLFAENALFVYGQSDQATYNAYYAAAENPQGFAATLGELGVRRVTVKGVKVDHEKPQRDGQGKLVDGGLVKGSARVRFSTDTLSGDALTTEQWVATISYHYTPLMTQTVEDPKTGVEETKIQDPKFQVVSYGVTQDVAPKK